MIALWWTKRSLDWSSGVMNPNPLSSLNHFTVPVAIVFLRRLRAANAEIAMSKGYERWHCCVGRIARPGTPTLAANQPRAEAALASTLGGRSRRPLRDEPLLEGEARF